jgi:hypothetical protein
MNIQISNTDGQLRVVQNGKVRFYNLKTIKSVDSLCDTNNNFYLVINFIANDKENALNVFLKDITNQVTWTNTSAGAETAKGVISGWMQDATIVSGTVSLSTSTLAALESVTVQNPGGASAVNIQDGGNSITVDGGTGLARTPGILRPTTSGNVNTAAATFYSVSVANVGSANGTVLSGVTIKPGEVLNFSADAINNFFTSFAYDATGTEFVITYIS